MARPKGSTGDAADRLLAAAGRGFRAAGFGGIGVDGLAKEAGLTSGAFYAHFKSKTDAFRAVVRRGLADLADGVRAIRSAEGATWAQAFIDFYIRERGDNDLAHSCALQSLTGEVTRADDDTRRDYQAELEGVLTAMTEGPSGLERARAMTVLALLSGGVTLARAVEDRALGTEILGAVRAAASGVARNAESSDSQP